MDSTMNGFDTAQIAELRERLGAERSAIAKRVSERRQALRDASVNRPDEGDWASDSVDQGMLARLMDRDGKLLREIDRAIAKMEAGTYGLCEASGEPIDFDRLAARPWSRLGLGAKEDRERAEAASAGDAPELRLGAETRETARDRAV